MTDDSADATQLLSSLRAGDPDAAEQLLPLVYDELHAMALRLMQGERDDHTLQPTALIHEAYLRLVDADRAHYEDRTHFVRVAARAMRQALVDHARAKQTQRRGARRNRVTLDESFAAIATDVDNLLTIDEALQKLAEVDPKGAQVVELRFFGGLEHAEIGRALEMSTRSAERAWRLGRAWLVAWLGDAARQES